MHQNAAWWKLVFQLAVHCKNSFCFTGFIHRSLSKFLKYLNSWPWQVKCCASSEFSFFPEKCALTLIYQFQCWEKTPVKIVVLKSTTYRVGLNGLDPFIKLCDFFFFFNSTTRNNHFVIQVFTMNKVVIAAVTSTWEHLLVQKY